VNFAVAGATFGLVFAAELPDKTALASLILGSRYRPAYVYAGVAAAFAVHVVLAIAAGSLLGLLPHRVLSVIVAVLFAAGAILLIRGRHDADELAEAEKETPPTFWRVAGTSFVVILIAEFGDLTQILIVNLAARYHDPYVVGVASLMALWAVAALAIAGGRGLLKVVPARLITLVGAGVMLVLAVVNVVEAIRG
jgi:putative Ca2+/H+ antiporter (TMEM165/GDT1 family)